MRVRIYVGEVEMGGIVRRGEYSDRGCLERACLESEGARAICSRGQ
jgi:hypothetical protein